MRDLFIADKVILKLGIMFPQRTFIRSQIALLSEVTLLGRSVPVRCVNLVFSSTVVPSPISRYSSRFSKLN